MELVYRKSFQRNAEGFLFKKENKLKHYIGREKVKK